MSSFSDRSTSYWWPAKHKTYVHLGWVVGTSIISNEICIIEVTQNFDGPLVLELSGLRCILCLEWKSHTLICMCACM